MRDRSRGSLVSHTELCELKPDVTSILEIWAQMNVSKPFFSFCFINGVPVFILGSFVHDTKPSHAAFSTLHLSLSSCWSSCLRWLRELLQRGPSGAGGGADLCWVRFLWGADWGRRCHSQVLSQKCWFNFPWGGGTPSSYRGISWTSDVFRKLTEDISQTSAFIQAKRERLCF